MLIFVLSKPIAKIGKNPAEIIWPRWPGTKNVKGQAAPKSVARAIICKD